MDWSKIVQLLKPYVASTIRHSASAAAGLLVTWGVIGQDQNDQTVKILFGAGMFAAAQLWSWVQKRLQARKLLAAADMGAAVGAAAAQTQSKAPGASVGAMVAFACLTAGMLFLSACATLEADAAIVQQKIAQNAQAIDNFCRTKVVPAINNPLTTVALSGANLLPYGGYFSQAVASAGAACKQIDEVAKSATTYPWLVNEVQTIEGKGQTAPPPVVAPAPVTSDTPVPTS